MVCLLVEASAPIARGDRFIADLVRPVDTAKVLVVNKIEVPGRFVLRLGCFMPVPPTGSP